MWVCAKVACIAVPASLLTAYMAVHPLPVCAEACHFSIPPAEFGPGGFVPQWMREHGGAGGVPGGIIQSGGSSISARPGPYGSMPPQLVGLLTANDVPAPPGAVPVEISTVSPASPAEPMPEPSTALLMAGALLAAIWFHRRNPVGLTAVFVIAFWAVAALAASWLL